MTELSSAAQAVHDAFFTAPRGRGHVDDDLVAIAAALRAAANQLTSTNAMLQLQAIADELEGAQ